MRYWRLFTVSFLLTLPIAGCHHKPERALPPPQAQAPVTNPLPTLPPLTLEPAILAQSQAAPPTAPPPAEAPPPKKHVATVRHHHTPAKEESGSESTEAQPPAPSGTAAPSAPGTAIIGQLSADDATATGSDAAQTKHLIDSTENEVKKLSVKQQTDHKDSVAQVESFLAQARQALSMNDVVGAQTLANKAKILVDELSK